MALCRERLAGLSVVVAPTLALIAGFGMAIRGAGPAGIVAPTLTLVAGFGTAILGTAPVGMEGVGGLAELVIVLLLFSVVPIALCFTLGVAGYAGVQSGVAAWLRGLWTAPMAGVLAIALGGTTIALMAIPYVGLVAAIGVISVLLLSYPLLAFEDVGWFGVWRRLWQLLRIARSRSGLLGPFVGLLGILGTIVAAAFVVLMLDGLLTFLWFGDYPEEQYQHPRKRITLGALEAISFGVALLVVPWSTVILAWVTQAYARIHALEARDQSPNQHGTGGVAGRTLNLS